MTAETYRSLTAWWRARPEAVTALRTVNRLLTYLGYFMYPLLLVLVLLFDRGQFAKLLLVPLVGFLAVTVLRRCVNEQRPYEALDIDPLIRKDTKGKSFPSRHIFSMATIALCWLCWCVPVGIVLAICCAAMGWLRVLGGVHYLHDVIAAALIAISLCIVGLWLLPL